MPAPQVARAMARRLAPDEDPDAPPGWLRPEQSRSFRRILHALRRYGGALLADPVGSGKTYVALAAAASLNRGRPTACLVPATLVEQWMATARALGLALVTVSHQSASRGRLPQVDRGLVVIDEAHHFRNPADSALPAPRAMAGRSAGAAGDRYARGEPARRSAAPAPARHSRRRAGTRRSGVTGSVAGQRMRLARARQAGGRIAVSRRAPTGATRHRERSGVRRMRGHRGGARIGRAAEAIPACRAPRRWCARCCGGPRPRAPPRWPRPSGGIAIFFSTPGMPPAPDVRSTAPRFDASPARWRTSSSGGS